MMMQSGWGSYAWSNTRCNHLRQVALKAQGNIHYIWKLLWYEFIELSFISVNVDRFQEVWKTKIVHAEANLNPNTFSTQFAATQF